MAFVEVLSDGTTVTRHSKMRGIPTYTDWLKFLLSRGMAQSRIDIVERDGKKVEQVSIIPRTRYESSEATVIINDQVLFRCICCGTAHPILSMSTIRVGGRIQIRTEEQPSKWEIVQGWKIQPTSRQGLGCRKCWLLYEIEVSKMNILNKERMELDLLRAELDLARCRLLGKKLVTRKGASPLTPWIDIFILPDVVEMFARA